MLTFFTIRNCGLNKVRNCGFFTNCTHLRIMIADMGSKANNDVTPGAKRVMNYAQTLQAQSGLPAGDFAKKCGMGRTYWFSRANGSAPLTISDCERIATTCGMTLRELFENALKGGADSQAERIARTLLAVHDDPLSLAAYAAPGKREAIDGEAGSYYDEPA